MSNRRQFLKKGLVAGLSASALPLLAETTQDKVAKPTGLKHWVWINPDSKDQEADLQQKYRAFYEAGIRGIFFEADSEKHFRAAKAQKLEAHRWMWTMNRGEKELLAAHPEWYAVNRKGESCADKPPRSEEHTSELQSRQYLVCRLLLEKKNNPNRSHHSPTRSQRQYLHNPIDP